MMLGVQSLTGLSPTWEAVFSQSLLMVLCSPPSLLCTACPVAKVLGPILFTLYSQPLWFLSMIVTITSTPMTLSCPSVHHLISSLLFSPVLRHVLMMFCWVWMNSNKLKLNTDKTEVMPAGSASRLESVDSECANIGGNSVPFKTSIKYLESILIERCQCSSTSAHLPCVLPRAPTNRVNPTCPAKELLQDLLWKWSYPALIIATRFSQAYQQTRSLGCSRCGIMQHGSWWKKKKKKKTRSGNTASQGTSLTTRKIPLPVQDRDSCLYYRHFERSLPPDNISIKQGYCLVCDNGRLQYFQVLFVDWMYC